MSKKLLTIIAAVVFVAVIDALALMYGWHETSFAVKWTFRVANFAIYLFLIRTLLISADMKGQMEKSRDEVQQNLREAEQKKAQADLRLQEAEEKIASLDEEVDNIRGKARQDAENEKARILERAKSDSQRILEKTGQEIRLRSEAAKDDLRRYAADRVAELASEELKKRLDDPARDNLFNTALKKAKEVFRA